jgi:hypothetical protein
LDGTCFDGDENHKLAVLGESRELGIRPGSNLENVDQSFRFSLYNTYTAAGRRSYLIRTLYSLKITTPELATFPLKHKLCHSAQCSSLKKSTFSHNSTGTSEKVKGANSRLQSQPTKLQ